MRTVRAAPGGAFYGRRGLGPPRTPMKRLSTIPSWLLVGLAGCSAPAAKSPADGGTTTTTADQAEDSFERAERDLHTLLLEGDEVRPGEPKPKPEAGIAEPRGHRASRCTRACKALASMQRSASQLCELAGGDDDRCKSAQLRVDAADRLVRQSCESCR